MCSHAERKKHEKSFFVADKLKEFSDNPNIHLLCMLLPKVISLMSLIFCKIIEMVSGALFQSCLYGEQSSISLISVI